MAKRWRMQGNGNSAGNALLCAGEKHLSRRRSDRGIDLVEPVGYRIRPASTYGCRTRTAIWRETLLLRGVVCLDDDDGSSGPGNPPSALWIPMMESPVRGKIAANAIANPLFLKVLNGFQPGDRMFLPLTPAEFAFCGTRQDTVLHRPTCHLVGQASSGNMPHRVEGPRGPPTRIVPHSPWLTSIWLFQN